MKMTIATFLIVCFVYNVLPAQNKYYLNSYNNVLDVEVNGEDLWVGTTKGLVHYNKNTGAVCGIYNASNSPIPTDNVFDVEIGPDGDVWMATQEGVFRFNGFGFQLIQSGLYIGLGFDDLGNMYASTKLEYEFCTPSYELGMFLSLNGFITSVAYNDEGFCYIHRDNITCAGGGSGGGCYQANFKDETVSNGVTTEIEGIDFENILLIDSIGNFWSTFERLSYFDPNTGLIETPQTDTLLPNPTLPGQLKFNAATQDSIGRIWLASTLGVFRFDGQDFVKYDQGLLGSLSIGSIDIDESGTIFIGSISGGVYRLNSNNVWESWLIDGLVSNGIYDMSSNTTDKYAFGGISGVSVFEDETITTYTNLNSILPTWLPYCKVYVDEADGVWVNANDSIEEVYYLSGSNWTMFNSNNSDLLSDDFEFIESNDQGEVWLRYIAPSVGAAGAKFQNGIFTNFITIDSLYENTVLIENKWTIEGYAAVKNDGGVITTYPIPESLFDSTCVAASAINANGEGIILIEKIWCGADLGNTLLRFRNNGWESISGNIGLWDIGQVDFIGDDIYISFSPDWYNCQAAHYKIIRSNNQIETYFLPEPGSISPNYGPIRDGYVTTTMDESGDVWASYISVYGNECWGPATTVSSSRIQLFKKTDSGFIRYAGPYCAFSSGYNYPRKMNTISQGVNKKVWIKGNLGIYSTNPINPMLTVFEKNSDCGSSLVACAMSGLQGDYQFEWSDGTTDPLRFSVDAGGYSCTLTDVDGTTDEATVILNTGEAIVVESSFVYESTPGSSDGSVSIDTVIGNYPPFEYLWNTGDTTSQIDSLAFGVYEVTITDQVGCTSIAIFPLYDDLQITFTHTDVTCNSENDGTIVLSIAGGLPPYDVDWLSSNSTSTSRFDLYAGEYFVTVSDNSVFVEEVMITITEPGELFLNSISNVNPDGVTGSIVSNVVGGTAPYVYLWNTGSDEPNLVDVPVGYYSLTVTDNQGCTDVVNKLLANPIEITGEVNSFNCNTDTIGFVNLAVEGGVPPYQYLWNTGDTTSMIDGLSQGDYTVTVTDSLGYNEWESFSFAGAYSLIYGIELQPEVTLGLVEAVVDYNLGSPPYDIIWSNGDTTEILSGVEPGYYSVSITDSNGCYGTEEVWLYYPLSIESVFTDSLCAESDLGMIDLSVTRGIPPYTYNWNFTSTDTSFVDMLNVGNYYVTINDSHEETTNLSFSIKEIEFTGIINLALNLLEVEIIEPGTPPYTYVWNTGSTSEALEVDDNGFYTVTVTDSKGCTFQSDYLVTTVNTTSLGNQSSIQIFPNPTSSILHVQCKTCKQFELFNIDGKQIDQNVRVGVGGIYELDMKTLPSGVYLLKVFDENHELLEVERVLLFH